MMTTLSLVLLLLLPPAGAGAVEVSYSDEACSWSDQGDRLPSGPLDGDEDVDEDAEKKGEGGTEGVTRE